MAIQITERKPGQRICTHRDDKGKMCSGHLKRWDQPDPETSREAGEGVELFRCERCHTLYRDKASEEPARSNVREVNLLGGFKKHES